MGALNLVRRAAAGAMCTLPPFRGKMRLADAVRRVLGMGYGDMLVRRNGVLFRVEGADVIERHLVFDGAYASPVLRNLSKLAQGKSVYWDIGANIGSVGLPVVAACPGLRAVFFEPSPPVLARLVQNISLNPELAARIAIAGIALAGCSGLGSFHVSREPHNSGVGGLAPSANRTPIGVRVAIFTGDDLIAAGELPPPGFDQDRRGGIRA